jgi:hypothetical protein
MPAFVFTRRPNMITKILVQAALVALATHMDKYENNASISIHGKTQYDENKPARVSFFARHNTDLDARIYAHTLTIMNARTPYLYEHL